VTPTLSFQLDKLKFLSTFDLFKERGRRHQYLRLILGAGHISRAGKDPMLGTLSGEMGGRGHEQEKN